MKKIVLLMVLVLLITGCTGQASLEAESKIIALESSLESTINEMTILKKEFGDMSKIIQSQKLIIGKLEDDLELTTNNYKDLNNKDLNESVYIDINDTGYNILKNEFGSFPISIVNAETYLNGYKLTIDVGNLLNTDFSSTAFHFVFPEKNEATDQDSVLEKFLKYKENSGIPISRYNYDLYKYVTHNETKVIEAGSWTRMIVVLPNITLKELEGFFLVADMSALRLYNN